MQSASSPSSTRLALWALAFGNVVIGTGALAFVGMLDTVAGDLRRSPSAIGLVAGAFSLGICLSGPLFGARTSRFDRRTVLTISLASFAVGHFASAVVDGYGSLLFVRVLTSFAGALFTPQAAATASLLVPAERRARAIAFIFLGWAIAAVAGVPAGAWIAATFGWRTAMAGIGGLSAVGAVFVWSCLPRALFVERIDATAWRAVIAHPTLLRVVAVTALHASAQFTLYSYIVIAFRDTLHPAPWALAALLSLNGLAGIGGNLVAGRVADRIGASPVVMVALSSMTAAFVLWTLLFATTPEHPSVAIAIAVVASVAWGAGNFAGNSMQQVRLVTLSPPLAAVSVALNTSAIYLGQFSGAALGGIVLAYPWAQPASAALPWVALPLFFAAIAVSRSAERPRSGATVPVAAS